MRATLNFLSEQSGLSITAISLILNNKPVRVAPEKKKLVLELAKKYNYRPNLTAVALVTKKTKTIGLILPDIVNPFFAVVASEIDKKFHRAGYSIILCNSNGETVLENQYINMLEEKQVDALIICASNEREQCDLSGFYEQGIPVVFFDRFYKDSKLVVSVNNSEGARKAVKHLIEKGHKNIAIITGPHNYRSALARLEGYKKTLKEAGLPVLDEYIIDGDYTFSGGKAATESILTLKGVTAIFACNDLMAYGVIKGLSDSGIRIPEDISIVGFDDLNFSQMLRTPLTSVKQNLKELADGVFDMTMKAMSSKIDTMHKTAETELIVRESVKDLNSGAE